jgi:hypothetical protein
VIPRPATDDEVEHFDVRDAEAIAPEQVVFFRMMMGGPEEGDDVIPCPTLISSAGVWRVAYQLDEIEVAALAQGGTLWLSTWSQLPVHRLEVIARSEADTISSATSDTPHMGDIGHD